MKYLSRTIPTAILGLFCFVPEARAQDAFGFEPGVSSGAISDPLTAHSPWQNTHSWIQGSVFTGYASDPVYACEMTDDGQCVDRLEPWVRDDWMATGDFTAHVLGGRLSANAAARLRLSSAQGAGLPTSLQSASTFDTTQFEDLRLSARWAVNPGKRLGFSPVASLRIDRQTNIVGDDMSDPALDLSPLYGLGNTVGAALPVGYAAQLVPMHFVFEPEGAVLVSSRDTHPNAEQVGLSPPLFWIRMRAAASWSPLDRLSVLSEAEIRVREDSTRRQAIPGAELRAGLRAAPTDGPWQVTAIVGHSPIKALGSPAFRGGLAFRWSGMDRSEDDAGPTLPPGRTLRLTIQDPSGATLPVTVDIDGRPAIMVDGGDGAVLVSVPDDQPHDLTIRSPGHATLDQVIQAPDTPDWQLERVLPLGDGDGVLVVRVLDEQHRAAPDVDLTFTRPDQPGPPVDLGRVCGDCGLTFSGLPEGAYDLGIQAPGVSGGSVPTTVSSTPPAAPDDILFLPPDPGRVGIRVVDPSGRVIPDAQLDLVGAEPTQIPLSPEGVAVVNLAPGQWAVEGVAPGFGTHQIPLEVDPLRPQSRDITLVLLPADDDGASLVVEVTDADGILVDGASVWLNDEPFCTTTSMGACSRDSLPEGPAALRIEHPDFVSDESGTIELQAGKEQKRVFALGWKPGATLIEVQDQSGMAADAKVLLEGPGGRLEVRTGPAGRQRKKLEPGAWSAVLREDGFRPVSVPFEVEENGNSRVPVSLSLLPALTDIDSVTLRVLVVDETDMPVQGAMVQLQDGSPGITSTDGIISVPIAAGTTRLDVRQEYFDPYELEVNVEAGAVQDVQAKLRSRLGSVRIVAVDPEEKGIDAQIQLTGPGGDTRQRRLSREGVGMYRLANGYWEVEFASQRNGFGIRDVEIVRETAEYEVKWTGILAAEPAILTAPERRPATVELWSRPDDAPTPGTVRLLGPEVLPPYEVGESGTWSGALRPGLWEVVALAPGLGIGGDDLSVETGETPIKLRIELGEVTVELKDDEVSIDDTLYFGLGSADVAPEARESLEAVARTLRSNPGIRKVRVEGHADRSGSAELNQTLSEDRARAVLDALVELGVERYRLESVGFGETQPISVTSAAGEARNRRVVFRVAEQIEAVKVTEDDSVP